MLIIMSSLTFHRYVFAGMHERDPAWNMILHLDRLANRSSILGRGVDIRSSFSIQC